MRRLVARLRRHIGGARPSPAPTPPDYDDARLVARLGASNPAGRAPALADAIAAFERGFHGKGRRAALDHFGARRSPRFFFDAATMRTPFHAALAGDSSDADLAKSLTSAAAAARDARTLGLRIYETRSAPLLAHFPWNNPGAGHGEDILHRVHVHRFAFLPSLALATASGAQPPGHVDALLGDWMAYAAHAPAWPFCSNLVVIQRLLASTWALALLGLGDGNDEACWKLLKILGQDVAFLQPRFGDSYPNNHLLADRFAAWYIALLLPELDTCHSPIELYESAWCAELERQTYDDGGGIEHSTHYHGLAAEMGAAFLLLSQANARAVAAPIRQRIAAMLRMQSMLCGSDGHADQIGDSSDDPLFPLGGSGAANAAALREVHRALFAPQRVPLDAGHPARARAWWLLGGRLAVRDGDDAAASLTLLPKAGFAIFSADADTTRLVFRLGPMRGTRYLPGHQHSDALSVTLVSMGTPMLMDAGTFTYRKQVSNGRADATDWRVHFAGAAAHNGIVFGGSDPYGTPRGDFRADDRLPEAISTASGDCSAFAYHEATLDSHGRVPPWTRGVIHLRDAGFIVYDDVARGATPAEAAVALQCAPECVLVPDGPAGMAIRAGAVAIHLAWTEGLGPAHVASGGAHPAEGWVSPAYGERIAAPRMRLSRDPAATLSAFAIIAAAGARTQTLECTAPRRGVRAFRRVGDDAIDVVILNTGAPGDCVTAFGVTFEGRALWIRIPPAGRPLLHWLDGRACNAPRWAICHDFPAHVAQFSD